MLVGTKFPVPLPVPDGDLFCVELSKHLDAAIYKSKVREIDTRVRLCSEGGNESTLGEGSS